MNSLARGVDCLLRDLCTEWGFCSRLSADQLLRAHATLTADLFARAVLEGEGMNPDLEVAWLNRIKDRFSERFGSGIPP